MRNLKMFAMLGALGALLLIPASYAQAQHVAIGVGIGVPAAPVSVYGDYGAPPTCAYGYYSYYPYACAPYGYYGRSWFVNGVFIGAGPWYRTYWGHPWRYDRDDRAFYGREYYRGRDFDRGRDFRRAESRDRDDFHGSAEFRGGHDFHGGDRGFHGGESHGGGFHGGGSHGGGHGGGHR